MGESIHPHGPHRHPGRVCQPVNEQRPPPRGAPPVSYSAPSRPVSEGRRQRQRQRTRLICVGLDSFTGPIFVLAHRKWRLDAQQRSPARSSRHARPLLPGSADQGDLPVTFSRTQGHPAPPFPHPVARVCSRTGLGRDQRPRRCPYGARRASSSRWFWKCGPHPGWPRAGC